MQDTLATTGQRAVVLGGPVSVTEATITTKLGTCQVTYADIGSGFVDLVVGAVCSHGLTAVSGTVPKALAILRRKHSQANKKA